MTKKNILIVGGSYGIGASLVTKIATDHTIHIAARTAEDKVANCTYHSFDVLKDDIANLDLPEVIDGLVYCPGSINLRPFKILREDAFRKDMEINFMSLMKVVHALLPRLLASEQASLVFFSSVAAQVGMPFHTSVAASKGAIEGFAKSLAAEYAPKFRVNVIAPSLTDTPLAHKLLSTEEKKEKMANRHPLKRIGTSAEIAEVAAFLLSENSSWITGQVLGVDGGTSTLNVH